MAGYIKLHRDIMNWEWYKDINVKVLFFHILLKANHKIQKWQGITINKGSFVTSLDTLAFETGLTKMQIRTALKKLILTHEITHETTRQYSIISITNWNKYQDINTQDNIQITHEQHTNNTRVTLNNNDKNDKNDKNEEEVVEEEIEKQKMLNDFYGEFKNVYLPKNRYDYLSNCILNETILNELINELSASIASNNEKYKPYNEKFPDAHFAHLKAFWKFRKEHPEKFLHKNTDSGGEDRKAMLERVFKRVEEEKAKRNGLKRIC